MRDLFPVVAENEGGGRRAKSNTAGAKIKVLTYASTNMRTILNVGMCLFTNTSRYPSNLVGHAE